MFIFDLFLPLLPRLSENLPRWKAGKGLGKPDEMEAGLMCGEHTKRDPPPFGERQVPFTPIIFRTKKVEKSSPQENIIFRTKNTEKSQPAFGRKNFGKVLWGNVSGKRKAPNLVERGQRR